MHRSGITLHNPAFPYQKRIWPQMSTVLRLFILWSKKGRRNSFLRILVIWFYLHKIQKHPKLSNQVLSDKIMWQTIKKSVRIKHTKFRIVFITEEKGMRGMDWGKSTGVFENYKKHTCIFNMWWFNKCKLNHVLYHLPIL